MGSALLVECYEMSICSAKNWQIEGLPHSNWETIDESKQSMPALMRLATERPMAQWRATMTDQAIICSVMTSLVRFDGQSESERNAILARRVDATLEE